MVRSSFKCQIFHILRLGMNLLKILNPRGDYWTHERSLTALLVYMSVSIFAWIPLSDYAHEWWSFVISDLLFNLIVLAGVFSVMTRWRKQLKFIGVAVAATSLRIVSFLTQDEVMLVLSYASAIAFFAMLARKVVAHIIKDGPVNFFRIQGSIVIYMMVGVVFAWLYASIEIFFPGSFSTTHAWQDHGDRFSQFLYFSFVTMTTLGFGDLIPTFSFAKSLVIFQGIFGMLYPVVMIARLVSMEVTHSSQNKK